MKRYRQSVLKAAVEGKLTEKWREAHKRELEPASKLLERVLKERREKWEARVYKEPKSPGIENLSELPDKWAWATVEQLAVMVQYGSSSKTSENPNGIPVLRMGNINDGKLVLDKLKYLPKNHDEFPELLLESGDILFNRTNSSELVGKTAVYKGNPHICSFASYLIRVKLNLENCPDFLSYYMNSLYGRKWISSVVSQQVGQANVNGTKLQALAVPLPPKTEQQIIVQEVERRLSIADEVESVIDAELKRAERLRQSILKRAFSGKLVPQDPSDEPATVLLERIKEEKAKREAEGKAKRKSRKTRNKSRTAKRKNAMQMELI